MMATPRIPLIAVTLFCIMGVSFPVSAQDYVYHNLAQKYAISSEHLNEEREYWVSLPVNYSDSLSYPAIYVLDAEWRFDVIRHLVYDMGFNGKIEPSIVVGIPHVEWEKTRSRDLTFSQSRMEYDGDTVDSTWYTAENSGGGEAFYQYLINELIPSVNQRFCVSGNNVLIGHSLGGYFGGYMLSMDHPFDEVHIYDPSFWWSNGEVTDRLKGRSMAQKNVQVYLTYQGEPQFHKERIEDFIQVANAQNDITLYTQYYPGDSHNGLFIDSFYQGIQKTHAPVQKKHHVK